ncbi:MAG TPA: prolyl oligopeptidase family serine peptidase, partial [Vicinamibacterales bacterium]|nr:prolyl oligopeptidase family serine peptidase [Vicinamibacterales bacterium]
MSRLSLSILLLTIGHLALPRAVSCQAAPAAPLSVERIASLPSLFGTAPAAVTWAPDSRRVAFLWNDSGWPYRDVWIVAADGTGLRRLTDFQRLDPAPAPPNGNTTAAVAARAAARAQGGASELLWTSDVALLVVHRGHLFTVAASGGTPERLPVGDDVSDVTVSPDGTKVAFRRGGDLWLWTRGAAAVERLTAIGVPGIATVPLGAYNKPDREVGTGVWGADWLPYAWSPDGQMIVFHAADRRHLRAVPFPSYLGPETIESSLRRGYPGDENERRTLSLLHLDTRAIVSIPLEAPGRRAISDFQWSPSGRLLIDQVSDTGAERWLYVVAPRRSAPGTGAGGAAAPRLIWHDRRDSRIYPSYVARWHPDGQRIVFVADLAERDQLFVLDPEAAAPTPVALTPDTWDVAGERGAATLVANAALKALVFTGTARGPYERHVYRLAPGDRAPVALTSLAGVHVPVLSPDGRTLASLWSDDVTPTELLVGAAQPGATLRRVTTSPPPGFAAQPWVRARYGTFTNAVDGFTVHARIQEPATLDPSRKYPVIFGPVYSNTVRNRWGGLNGALQQYLVQQGYIVVQVDVRGSVGYGRAFREAFLMDYGGKDLDDLQAVVDGLKTLPYVDDRHMGIWGSSYGGLLSAYALLKRPGMFAAGVAGAPATDPYAFGPDDVAITRSPDTNPDAFVRGSAQELGADLQDHLLIIHGMMDDVVPFRTTLALAERLMLLGKDFD